MKKIMLFFVAFLLHECVLPASAPQVTSNRFHRRVQIMCGHLTHSKPVSNQMIQSNAAKATESIDAKKKSKKESAKDKIKHTDDFLPRPIPVDTLGLFLFTVK